MGNYAFSFCYSLRNVAFPPNAKIDDVFRHCQDLQQLFSSGERISNALKDRFDTLPIHKMLYYQSHQPVRVEQLSNATNMRSGQLRFAILLYAVWGNAPSEEIVQCLVESYKAIYPKYELDWTKMAETLGLANVPKGFIQKVADLQKEYFPKQNIDWERLLESVIDTYHTEQNIRVSCPVQSCKTHHATGLKHWRDAVKHTTENCSVYCSLDRISLLKSKSN